MPPQRIKVDAARPDDAHVAAAVDALRCGRRIALPTETVYGFAAVPEDEASVAALRELKGRDAAQPFTFHIGNRAQLDALAMPPPPRIARLIERYWPGPLTLILPGRHAPTVGVRMPAHGFTQRVLDAFPHGLFLSSSNRSGEPELVDPDAIARAFPALDALFDSGRSPLGRASTIVRLAGKALEVVREGILTRDEIFRAAAASCLFVCTGNTCRSPMAQALARARAARALGVPPAGLPARGLVLRSAGISTFGGMPASETAERALAEIGLDLSAHVSTQLTAADARRAARIYCLTGAHREQLLEMVPDVADKVALLAGSGEDIADPFGGPLEVYRETRERIDAAIARRLPEIVALADA
jgi:tRNA threonylcarbamoyl adenosine modification protein (Sua5/YciO/YrdC/YwlC family)